MKQTEMKKKVDTKTKLYGKYTKKQNKSLIKEERVKKRKKVKN